MRPIISFLLLAGCLAFALTASAQVGSLGKPAVSETFDAGPNPGGPLPSGVTNMSYTSNSCPDDGSYTIVNSTSSSCFSTWFNIPTDHTGDPNGYFMLVNASYTPSVFYTKVVKNDQLCSGTTYLFNAYIMNVVRAQANPTAIEPNITFRIESSKGVLLAPDYNTGGIQASTGNIGEWKPYHMTFVSPTDNSDVVIKMINNAPGGNGNDLALDDITFSPYGPVIQAGFNNLTITGTQNKCIGDPINYTLVANPVGYTNADYQWQYKTDGDTDWQNVKTTGAKMLSLPVSIPSNVAGMYQYRIGVLDASKTSENCRIYSDPLTINVYAEPVNTLAATSSACAGLPLVLTATGGDTYDWVAPNGTHYSSTTPNTTITPTASASDNGIYHLTITKNGCPTFATTAVTVYQPATIDPITEPAPICEGSSVTLTTSTHNATHYQWTPSLGLDRDDIASPVATPAVTTLYTLTVSNDGCSAPVPPATVNVTVLKSPFANAGDTIKIYAGQSTKLAGTANGDNVHYFWTPSLYLDNASSLTPIASPPQDITYTLHVESEDGCGESTSSVFVRVYQLLKIPNTFTPNGDGYNDRWEIKNLDTYPKAYITIFNRNGQLIFHNKGAYSAWNGTYNGAPLPVGTYYYVIDLVEDGLPKPSGWVFIAR
jgi:gliding motility-associated-like protein